MKHNTFVTGEDFKELLEFGSIAISNDSTGLLGIALSENSTKLRITGLSFRRYSISKEFAKNELENIINVFETIQNKSCQEFRDLIKEINKAYSLLFDRGNYALVIGEYSEGNFKWDDFVK